VDETQVPLGTNFRNATRPHIPMTQAQTPTAQAAPRAARHPVAVPSPHGTRIDDYYWLRDDTRSQ